MTCNLKDLVDIVRQSRERTADVFPLPNVDDCIDFAITEAAEYIDAKKRENPIYKRNRDKEHSPRKEWGQCGYMIASAIIQRFDMSYYDDDEWEVIGSKSRSSVYVVLGALVNLQKHEISPLVALDAWYVFAEKQGYDPAELLRETCAAFEAKHLRVKA